jgi:hypothetical protein
MATRFDTHRSLRISEKSGLCTGIAAGGSIFQFRNSHATLACLIRRIEVAHLVTTGYTAAQEVGYHVMRGTSWSVAPSGGTALTLTGAFGKLNTSAGSTILAANDVRVATTGALTDGTVTLDTHLLGADAAWALAGTAGGAIGWNAIMFDDAPGDQRLKGLLLQNNEGFVIKSTIAQGAAGVGRWFVNVVWDEGQVVG